jgi:hypothetical protein
MGSYRSPNRPNHDSFGGTALTVDAATPPEVRGDSLRFRPGRSRAGNALRGAGRAI